MARESSSPRDQELEELRCRLDEAEQTLRAIRTGEVDSLVVEGPDGPRVFALEGADSAYRVLVEGMSEGAATVAEDGTILYCNQRFARMLEAPPHQVMGSSLRTCVAAASRWALDGLLRRAAHGESKGEVALRSRSGGEVPAYVSVSAVGEGGRRVLCLLATDLTERRRAEALAESERVARSVLEATRESEERLRDADRRKDEFLNMLSHELRNPLGPISNALYLLEHGDPLAEPARRARQVIARQVSHLTGLVDDLLEVTRISNGKIQLHRTRVELAEVVRRAVEDHQAVFAARDIELNLHVDGRPHCVDADPGRITQIVGNLLQNAAKFTEAHGHVAVSVEGDGPSAALRVRDDGVGMDAETLPHVFEAFRQADRTLHRSTGGLGLGLALVKGLVQLHGGRVTAESAGIGRGSEFAVWLPLAAQIPLEIVLPRRAALQLPSLRVLVVEDNLDNAETLKDVLQMKGQDVAVAHDGPGGVARAMEMRPDVVLCDIGLPGLDGYEVARRIRAEAGRAPFLVALTGYARPEDRRAAIEAGFDDHLAKPVDVQHLVEILERVGWTGSRSG
ncbi:MAG TPA: ATP-binding protein [Anaeromyxobacteraceae bacterium]|nr:ATP-binding protein [Anaeromyxobacteraceae bacterium]